jgi:hypothetical protein
MTSKQIAIPTYHLPEYSLSDTVSSLQYILSNNIDVGVSPLIKGKVYREFSHEELLADMRRFAKEVTSSKEKAEAFMRKLGVLSEEGELKRLIHD